MQQHSLPLPLLQHQQPGSAGVFLVSSLAIDGACPAPAPPQLRPLTAPASKAALGSKAKPRPYSCVIGQRKKRGWSYGGLVLELSRDESLAR